MKAFVVALLLLCGFCAACESPGPKREGFKPKKWMPKDKARSEYEVLKLKPLPCTFEVKYTQTYPDNIRLGDSFMVIEGEFKRYGLNFIDKYSPRGSDEYSVIMFREFVNDPAYEGFFTSIYGNKNMCQIYEWEPGDHQTYESQIELYTSRQEIYCVSTEETTWQGKKCTNCTMDGVSYYVNDGHIIGFEDREYDVTWVMEYTFKDVRKDIVISTECKYEEPKIREAVPSEAYTAPKEEESCGTKTKTIQLKELPCTYGFKLNYWGESESTYKIYGNSMLRTAPGGFGKGKGRDESRRFDLIRPDIQEEGNPWSALVVCGGYQSECYVAYSYYANNYTDLDAYFDDEYDMVQHFLSMTEFECSISKEVTWKDKKCTLCVRSDEYLGLLHKAYVKDGLMIGLEGDGIEVEIEYMFEDFRKEMAVNKTCVEWDPIPTAAYSEPKEISSCSHEPKSRDAGTITSVAAALIICMVMITLISLF